MNEQVSQHLFNQGLILAARASGAPTCFVAEGPKWDAAFDALSTTHLSGDQPLIFSWWRWVRKDPIFGYYPTASDLLLQGEQDLLLNLLSPQLSQAVFLLTAQESAKELGDLPHFEWFMKAGAVFAESLTAV